MVIDTPFEILRVAKKFRPAMRAYWMMAANDPILAIYVTVTALPLKGKLTRLLSATPPIAPTARKFLSMDPDVGLDGPIAAIPRIRQRRLAAADRAVKIKAFSVL
jgi:hypothetical protein